MATMLLCLVLTPAMAVGQSRPDPEGALYRFASCAGRLSALMEHQWLMDPAASDRTDGLRRQVLELLAAVAQDRPAAQAAMMLRIETKAAHAALLSAATFGANAAASDQARRLERACTSLLGLS
ncbi:hypothetical protein SAMN05421774_10413 [Gemmobacter megaterium]|uniref:DUF5667 domain-containing protein n=2 Tax=Gemmobacter megaterium TaxID=1086013 RepID=A0A1N7NNC3_9RHOB|nr:hypothetical protein SAMN05421774_10413 [Gemmobacter megaterium]